MSYYPRFESDKGAIRHYPLLYRVLLAWHLCGCFQVQRLQMRYISRMPIELIAALHIAWVWLSLVTRSEWTKDIFFSPPI